MVTSKAQADEPEETCLTTTILLAVTTGKWIRKLVAGESGPVLST